MATSIKPTVYRDMKTCILGGEYESFLETCFFHLQGSILSSFSYEG